MGPVKRHAPTLRQAQEWMASVILSPERVDREEESGMVDVPSRGSVADRLHVYTDGYPARVQEALAETFPAVAHVIGPRALASLVERYVRAVALRSYNLNDAGAGMPAFLGRDTLCSSFPFLPDLARLEWRVARAFRADQHPPLDPSPLAAWSVENWEGAVLRFQPAVALVCSEWPIREIWAARSTPVEKIDINLEGRPERALVYRLGLEVKCESLGAEEAAAIGALLSGQSLGTVNRMLSARDCDPAAVSTWFARWSGLGLITHCTSPSGFRPPRAGHAEPEPPPPGAQGPER